MAAKSDSKKNIGNILLGFAVLMFGMETMSAAVEPLKDVEAFTNILTMFQNPILGVLAGAVLTAVIQSSSASVGILQALSSTGKITFGAAIPIIMGQNIGTCVTALISCIGAKQKRKTCRNGAFVFQYYRYGFIPCIILCGKCNLQFCICKRFCYTVNIAIVHTIFNVVATAVLLPFNKLLEKLARMTIKEGAEESAFGLLDERFLQTPSFAVEQCMTLATNMAYMVKESFTMAQECVAKYSESIDKKIIETENLADEYEDALGAYLVKLSAKSLNESDSQKVSILLHAISDFEKMTDYTADLVFTAREKRDKDVHFSDKARQEITIMVNAVGEIIDLTISAFSKDDVNLQIRLSLWRTLSTDLEMT